MPFDTQLHRKEFKMSSPGKAEGKEPPNKKPRRMILPADDEATDIPCTSSSGSEQDTLSRADRSDGELVHILRLVLQASGKHPGMRSFIKNTVEKLQHQCGLDFDFPPDLILSLTEYIKDDRVFYNTLTTVNKEIHEKSKTLLPLWPQKAFELQRLPDAGMWFDFRFSSDSNSLLVHQARPGPDRTADITVLTRFNVRSGISNKEIRHPFPLKTSLFSRHCQNLLTYAVEDLTIQIHDVENELSPTTIEHGHQDNRMRMYDISLCGKLLLVVTSHDQRGDENCDLSVWEMASKRRLFSLPNLEEHHAPANSFCIAFTESFILYNTAYGELRILNFSPDSRIAHPVLRLQDVGTNQVWDSSFFDIFSNPKDSSILATSVMVSDGAEMRLWKLCSSGLSFDDGRPIIDSIRALCPPHAYLAPQAPAVLWFPCGRYLLLKYDDASFLLLGVVCDPVSKAYSIQEPSDKAPAVRLIEKANRLLAMRSRAGYGILSFRIAPNGKSIAIRLQKGGESKHLLQLVSI